MRTCVGCRQPRRVGVDRLVRLVARPDGSVGIGRTLPGRGAWLCEAAACLDQALRRKALGRALRVDLGVEAIERLRSNFPGSTPGARD